MNYRIIGRFLSAVSYIVGFSMLFSLPWACAEFGGNWECERRAFGGLILSALIAFVCGTLFSFPREKTKEPLLRKESLAIVALSWILATVLCALPYLFAGTWRDDSNRMSVADAIFESQSGLSTTGASVLACLEDPTRVPRTILFWRSTTHFLGGVGFMFFFVVLLGQGNSGRAVLRLEQTKVSPRSPQAKMRESARILMGIYLGLNVVMALCLWSLGVSIFDSLCHAFSTISTGGFSTFQASVGHFAAHTNLNAGLIESIVILFMILGGTNFILLFWCIQGKPGKMFRDIEWQTYIGIMFVATCLIFSFGILYDDFAFIPGEENGSGFGLLAALLTFFRTCLFQVVSIMTTTGFATTPYEMWNSVSILIILVLFYIGGCSGSTAGGTKVIRTVLAFKSTGMEIERTWRPNVIRTFSIGDDQTVDRDTVSGIIFFLFLMIVFTITTTLLVIMIEPRSLWLENGKTPTDKLLDLTSASLSMYSNVGPALGVAGANGNYGGFSGTTKIIFSWAMLLGRLELFTVLALFVPSFWKKH